MALKLTVLTEQRDQLGSLSSIVFGVGGGGIGRASDNDWVLPDPERYLSAHHARIQFRNGSYQLLDTSTNGVYVNDGTAPIGRRGTHTLRHGDILRFGNYQVAVAIDTEPDHGVEAPEASSIFPVQPQALGTQPAQTRADIGSSLQVHDLLSTLPDVSAAGRSGAHVNPPGQPPAPSSNSTSSNARMRPVGAFGQSPLTEDTAMLAFDSGVRSAVGNLSSASASTRQGRLADRALENLASIEAFCRGAGIDPKHLPMDSPARLLHLAGVLLREALVGLKGLALSQRETREQMQVEAGKEDPQHIGLTGLPVEDLLSRLLIGHERRDLDAVLWVREMLASTRRHDVATLTALRSALSDFVARLEPRALMPDGQTNGAALMARFHSITDAPSGALPHLFIESFARAFLIAYRQQHGDLQGKVRS